MYQLPGTPAGFGRETNTFVPRLMVNVLPSSDFFNPSVPKCFECATAQSERKTFAPISEKIGHCCDAVV